MYSENDNSSSNQSAAQTDDLFMKDFKLLRQFKDSDLTKPDGGDLKLIVVRELTRDKQNDNLKVYKILLIDKIEIKKLFAKK
jgi:hypothetical protein